jgi:hypothetical protein
MHYRRPRILFLLSATSALLVLVLLSQSSSFTLELKYPALLHRISSARDVETSFATSVMQPVPLPLGAALTVEQPTEEAPSASSPPEPVLLSLGCVAVAGERHRYRCDSIQS